MELERDLSSCCCSWSKRHSTRDYDRVVPQGTNPRHASSSRSRASIWAQLWRKIRRENKKMFQQKKRASSSMRFSYDPRTYSQNFDQGLSWESADSDDLSRSFSARFAVPTRIFDHKDHVLVL